MNETTLVKCDMKIQNEAQPFQKVGYWLQWAGGHMREMEKNPDWNGAPPTV